jgi:Raf kinase inhibitor-like YbhB/YbcL family protein
MAFEIHSSAFLPGQPIPKKYSQDGENISPPVSWSGIPSGTRELVLVVEDPDAPKPFPNPFIHWILYKIPPDVLALNEAIPTDKNLLTPTGATQGQNSAGKIGYVGPAPPLGHGTHHYHFKLFVGYGAECRARFG